MKDYRKSIKGFFLFSEPESIEKFILRESKREDVGNKPEGKGQTSRTETGPTASPTAGKTEDKAAGKTEDKAAGKTEDKAAGKTEDKVAGKTGDKAERSRSKDNAGKEQREAYMEPVSTDLSVNLRYMKKVYSIPENGDMILREFDIVVKDKVIPAFMLFFDGMVDRKVINDDILQPLMLLSNLDIKGNSRDISKFILSHIMPHNQVKETKEYREVIDEINFGGCGIFVDGINSAFAADVKGWEHRGVERPNTETVLRGPQEGFTEILRVNTALIRKTLKDEDLIVENVEIGRRSKTPCSILYIKDIANKELVGEVRRRLKSIKTDYITDSGELEQYMEDSTVLPAPQVIATERPDRTAALLGDGRVVVILHGSPFALIVPATITDLVHSAEDAYLRFPYVNFLRIIRYTGIVLSLLLPGLYIAITNYHQEMIPTDLLFAIEASREKVPFPSIVEIMIMEFAFELIREAGIRIPGPIGPTLGIIGALILGQAAVAASIVSPILIIIVAVTGIGSFAIPNYSFGIMFRLLRFGYILLGGIAGFLGIALGVFIQGLFLVQSVSMGVPMLVPLAPKTADNSGNGLIRTPVWKQEERADYLNTQDDRKQPKISRRWVGKSKAGDNDEQ